MEANKSKTNIKMRLPHGAIVEIAKRAGVLPPTVSRALNGDTSSPKLPEIISATAYYLKDYNEKLTSATKTLNDVLSLMDLALETEPIKGFVDRLSKGNVKHIKKIRSTKLS